MEKNKTWRHEELNKVAFLSHVLDFKQVEIAKRLNVSPMTVSRMLKEAKKLGIVETSIQGMFPSIPRLERGLCLKYGLSVAFVIQNVNGETITPLLARAGAYYLPLFLKRGHVIGIASGRTIGELSKHIRYQKFSDLCVVQLLGGLVEVDWINPLDITHTICNRLNARGIYFQAPMFAPSEEFHNRLFRELVDGSPLGELWQKCSLTLMGVGMASDSALGVITGFIKPQEMTQIAENGGVGDIMGHFFDINGNFLDMEINRRVMAIPIDLLKKVPRRIAISGGIEKVDTIKGGLRTGCVNILVTDEVTAEALLEGEK